MAEIPNLTQFIGQGPTRPDDVSAPTGDESIDWSIPSAWDNPDLWDNITFRKSGDDSAEPFSPFPDGMGVVHVKVAPAVKIDKKGGAGKKTPRNTKTGGEPTKIEITIKAVSEAWPYVLAASRQLFPGEDEWEVTHPKLMIAGVLKMQIEKWKDAPDHGEGGLVTWEIEGVEVKPGAQAGTGGGSATSTPDASDDQRADPNGAGLQKTSDQKKYDPNGAGLKVVHQKAAKP